MQPARARMPRWKKKSGKHNVGVKAWTFSFAIVYAIISTSYSAYTISTSSIPDENSHPLLHLPVVLPPSYTVCNGMNNQLLGHLGHISKAIASGEEIRIPDVFIINGVQNGTEDVLPTRDNSVPLSKIIDLNALLQKIASHGVKAQLVPFHDVVAVHKNESEPQQSCDWARTLKFSNHQTAQELLHGLKPSPSISKLVQAALSKLLDRVKSSHPRSTLSDGICMHHRDGLDWHAHCQRWEGIKDGVWRKNCLNDRQLPLHELVKNRIPAKAIKSWIYYIGDQEPSIDMVNDFKEMEIDLIHRKKDKLLLDHNIAKAVDLDNISLETHRDLFTAVDYFACAEIETFIGNSVSTFSANQIAKRGGMKSSWYNSRSIPLAGMFTVFNVPFVYTYTEESQPLSKHLLKASILSIRGSFGTGTDINILYHGSKDEQFIKWLKIQNVIIHKHDPMWLGGIEKMRRNGSEDRSHLFEHKGNYIGTWQRIDIPLFINAEYCMFMDSDTIVHTTFGMHNFGLDVTPSIAVSAEAVETDNTPINLGVALMNVPMLRETYDDFLSFILAHTDNPVFKDNNISDQGAYLEFYGSSIQFLPKIFNVKPYCWNQTHHFDERKVVHFHGLKPHDILKAWMGSLKEAFPPAVRPLLNKVVDNKSNEWKVCKTMYDFSLFIVGDTKDLDEYCDKTFGSPTRDSDEESVGICIRFFTALAGAQGGKVSLCREQILNPMLTGGALLAKAPTKVMK